MTARKKLYDVLVIALILMICAVARVVLQASRTSADILAAQIPWPSGSPDHELNARHCAADTGETALTRYSRCGVAVRTFSRVVSPDGRQVTMLSAQRDQVMQNLDVLIQKLRIIPFMKGGRHYGSRVEYLEAGCFVWALGLRQGDIILEVNGRKINAPDDTFFVFDVLRHNDRVQVKIDRNGKVLLREIDFN